MCTREWGYSWGIRNRPAYPALYPHGPGVGWCAMRPAVGSTAHYPALRVYSILRYPTGRWSLHDMVRETSKLLKRVRRIRGQIEAVERALEQEIGCEDIMQLIAPTRGAI